MKMILNKKLFILFTALSLSAKLNAQDMNALVMKVKAKLEKVKDYTADGRMKTDVAAEVAEWDVLDAARIQEQIKTRGGRKETIRGVYVAKREAWRASNRTLSRSYMGHFSIQNMNFLSFSGKTRPRIHFFMRKRRVFLRARKTMFR